MLKRDEKVARRAPHLHKKHLPGADQIDKLDATIGGAYHHEGPFDATLLARNNSFTHSPVAAVSSTNEEALKATPRENIKDAVEQHRPLEGTAYVPPGEPDRFGRTFEYQEGENMMIEHGGDYKRWPGVVRPITSLNMRDAQLTLHRTTVQATSMVKGSQPTPLRGP